MVLLKQLFEMSTFSQQYKANLRGRVTVHKGFPIPPLFLQNCSEGGEFALIPVILKGKFVICLKYFSQNLAENQGLWKISQNMQFQFEKFFRLSKSRYGRGTMENIFESFERSYTGKEHLFSKCLNNFLEKLSIFCQT